MSAVGASCNPVSTRRLHLSNIRSSVQCANVSRVGSSNLSFATKPCACAAIAFLAQIISLQVDYMPWEINPKLQCGCY
jgi:hypothetical protein